MVSLSILGMLLFVFLPDLIHFIIMGSFEPSLGDISVFSYVSQQITQGHVLYKDMIDVKGPLLFFINAFGLLMTNGHYIGIVLIRFIVLFGSGRVACSDLGVLGEASMVWSEGTSVNISSTALSLSITTFELWAASIREEISESR